MFCKQCGKPIDDGQELCEECKTNVEGGKQESNKTNQSSQDAQNSQTININLNTNNNSNTNTTSTPKSKVAAGVLGILLGSLGVHNFYLGYTGKAVAQLLISLLTCGTCAWISGIWGFIEGILILTGSINTDANGNPLSN